jgi:hypothetical protein
VTLLQNRCPVCGRQTLFVSPSGWLTCSWLGCDGPALERLVGATTSDIDRARAEVWKDAVSALVALRDIAVKHPRDRQGNFLLGINSALNKLQDVRDRVPALGRL